jgi:hypothetical protein
MFNGNIDVKMLEIIDALVEVYAWPNKIPSDAHLMNS